MSATRAAALLLCAASVSGAAADRAAWADFKQRYQRAYATAEEEARRFAVFASNLRSAEQLQAENPHADFGVTKFSDRTRDEFHALLGSRPAPADAATRTAPKVVVRGALPIDVDWTGRATTPVKDQGECGSCWAFSAVEQVESDFMLQKNVTVILGVQEVVDCMGNGLPRLGCTGGNPDKAYGVMEKLGGVELEKDYPYRGWLEVPTCHYKQEKAVVTVADWAWVGKKDETEMKNYVGTTGPLSVCVNAESWHSYKSGIMTTCSSKSTDHCVQIVGYGTDAGAGVNGTKYWKVRNSWGTSFGEGGYLRIARGKNLCNIQSAPSKTTAGEYIGPAV